MALAAKVLGLVALLAVGFVYWSFALRVRQILRERHAATWAALSGDTVGLTRGLYFAWRRGDRSLNDDELTRNIVGLRRASVVVGLGMLWWAGVVFGLY